MPSGYSTEDRFLYLNTPLGPDQLMLTGFEGHEAISQLFSFRLDLMAENRTNVAFDKLLGQPVGFGLEAIDHYEKRPLHGIVIALSQLSRDKEFTHYQMEIAPQFWLLTQVFRSRIFQHKNVPDILKAVLAGIDADFQIQGTFHPREYCVQYNESDFAFASRLMEEEGIYYFFKFNPDGHRLVLANMPQSHVDVPGEAKLIFDEIEGGERGEERISSWEKVQQLRSGKYTLWDHSFELPHKHLEAEKVVIASVQAGKVTHKLKIAGNDQKLEIYEYPGSYAHRFDGVDKTGGDTAADIQKIFEDNKRTASIRMGHTEAPMLQIRGASNCRHLTAGYRFTLDRHFNGDGAYAITSVDHDAREADYRSGQLAAEGHYGNMFTCLPLALPYVPERKTPRPRMQGCQTAVVCGPGGEEIFTDKYGRIKVQFHWDRDGNYDADSSCWLRVATTWAGKQWGAISLPRIGQEVIVDFLEGNPDNPIVVGSVYNADTMPAYKLPDNKTRSGVKSRSSTGGGGFNEIRFEDKKDSEQIFISAQKDLDLNIGKDRREGVGNDRHLIVGRDEVDEVGRDWSANVKRDSICNIGRDQHEKIAGKKAESVGGSYSLKVDGDSGIQISGNEAIKAGGDVFIKAGGKIVLSAGSGITLSVGGNHVTIDPSGVTIVGTMVKINSGGSALSGTGPNLVDPLKALTALKPDSAVPGGMTFYTQMAAMSAAELSVQNAPTHDPDAEQKKEKTAWVEIEMKDPDGKPAGGLAYRVTLTDGSVTSGSLDEKGTAHVAGLDPGQVKITFPDLDKDAWEAV